MSRPNEPRKKVNVSSPAVPLGFNPFAALGEVEALKNLAPAAAPEPKKPERAIQASAQSAQPKKSRGRLILRREKKDRGGKVVVIIFGFAELPGANAVMIADLARELKGKLGCGGSFDRQEIILQGDRCADVCAALENMGFRVDGVRA
jgi:translation initiation factor 1